MELSEKQSNCIYNPPAIVKYCLLAKHKRGEEGGDSVRERENRRKGIEM